MINYASTKDGTALAVEASDLNWPAGQRPTSFHYDGATFVHVRTERDRDHDIVAWHYVSNDRGRLVVFND